MHKTFSNAGLTAPFHGKLQIVFQGISWQQVLQGQVCLGQPGGGTRGHCSSPLPRVAVVLD